MRLLSLWISSLDIKFSSMLHSTFNQLWLACQLCLFLEKKEIWSVIHVLPSWRNIWFIAFFLPYKLLLWLLTASEIAATANATAALEGDKGRLMCEQGSSCACYHRMPVFLLIHIFLAWILSVSPGFFLSHTEMVTFSVWSESLSLPFSIHDCFLDEFLSF